jgi:hypothetical protein
MTEGSQNELAAGRGDGHAVVAGDGTDPRAVRILRGGVWLAVAATAIQTLVHLTNIVLLGRHFTLLDAESDISLWAWASTATEAAAAAFAALLAFAATRLAWRPLLLAGLLAFLSADDILALHERIAIDQLGPIPHASRLIWPLVFGPILVLTGWLLLRGARDASRGVRRLTIAGLAALVVAVLMEAATPVLFALGQGHGSIPYELESVVEEGLELGGFVLIATALAAQVTERLSRAPSPQTDR